MIEPLNPTYIHFWFTIVQTLAKTLNIQPFISGETATYLRQYFQPGKIQVLEDHFCNHNALPSIIFNEDLDYLVEHTELHKGKILQLWPWGYKVVLKRNNYITLQKSRFFWQIYIFGIWNAGMFKKT